MPTGSAAANSATYKPLAIVLMAVVVGINADRYEWPAWPQSFGGWWLVAAIAWTGWLVGHLLKVRVVPQALLLFSLAAAGGAWHHARWNLFADDDLGRFATLDQQPICLEVVATSSPKAIPAPPYDPLRIIPLQPQSRLRIEARALRRGKDWQPISGSAQLSIDGHFSEIQAGDRLRVFGLLAAPSPAENPGEFDFAAYARGQRHLASVRVKFAECVETVATGNPWSPWRWISQLRQRGNTLVWEHLSRDQIGLASGILLGERELIDRDLNDAFLQTGTIHILSISGLHVGILAWLLFMVLRSGLMSQRAALLSVVAITGIYMLLTDSEPPVMRATLLVWIVCGAKWLGRPAMGLNSLALAALVVLAVNPCGLFNSGVQLSFLSVAVLMKLAQTMTDARPIDPLDRLIDASRPWPERVARRLKFRTAELFMVGLALWLVITPITMLRFNLISPSALVLNVILMPVVTFALAGGFGVLLFGWLIPPLGTVCGWVCNANLWILEQTVRTAADLPGSYFWTPAPSLTWLTLLYLSLAAVLWMRPVSLPWRWRTALAGGWCGAILLATLPSARPTDSVRCTFISVGHGCSVLLELPDGKNLLYDAGRLGSPQAAARSISSVLWSRGIRHIDALVLSHADLDHYNAVPALAERFGIGVVYVSPMMFSEGSPALNVLRKSLEEAQVPIAYTFAGDRLRAGDDIRIDVLHPPSTGVIGSDNANSIVLAVERAGRRVLITGDLEAAGLNGLLEEMPYDVDVLVAPHHGSTSSDPLGLVRWCTPEIVVITGSRNDQSPVVRKTYEMHGARVHHTAQNGAISILLQGEEILVETHRPRTAESAIVSRQTLAPAVNR